jgi:hypothetical protein
MSLEIAMNATSPKRSATLAILVSLMFAAGMLIISYVMADSPNRETAVFLMIALWWIPFSYLSAGNKSCCRTRRKEAARTEEQRASL